MKDGDGPGPCPAGGEESADTTSFPLRLISSVVGREGGTAWPMESFSAISSAGCSLPTNIVIRMLRDSFSLTLSQDWYLCPQFDGEQKSEDESAGRFPEGS